ncbi:MAG: FMN-binding protein [Deltaproteobacteria bacterium]|nr:FMN-binding protein [Deltaproteobacteria bacterium]
MSEWATSSERLFLGLLAAAVLCGIPIAAQAKVFLSRTEALDLAFPHADRVDSQTYILSAGEAARIEKLSRSPLDSMLVEIYTGFRGGVVSGYAVIDIHNVRTLPEAFMVVLSPAGEVQSLRLLAFHEPLQYRPTDRWYTQFDDKSLAEPLRVGGDVHGVVGATLSARATARGVRRVLAFYEVLIESGRE